MEPGELVILVGRMLPLVVDAGDALYRETPRRSSPRVTRIRHWSHETSAASRLWNQALVALDKVVVGDAGPRTEASPASL